MFNFKNGISPVIAVILLLAITVVISMSMYSFLKDYTENTTSSLSSTNFNSVKVIGIYGDKLYLDSEESKLFSLFQIKDLNGNIQCEIRDSKQSTFQGDTRLLMTFDSDTVNSTHVKDLSGYDNHGLINGSTYTENNCVSGGCFEFNTMSEFIEVPFSENLSFTNHSFTVSTWFNPEILQGGNSWTDGDLISSNPNFQLKIVNNSKQLAFMFYNELNWSVHISNSNFNYDSWNKMDVVFTKLTNSAKIEIYSNSYLIYSNISSRLPINNGFNLFIGAYGENTEQFFGRLDEVAIYSKALNQEEVSKLYELKSAKFYEQILSTQTKEIDVSNCNLNKNSKYEFVGILESGTKISEKIIIK